MSSMSSIMDVFNMNKVTAKTRAKLLIKLGQAVNNENQSNITNGLVKELIDLLPVNTEDLHEDDIKWLDY
jgi:myosin-crossreactive antigen